MSKKTLFSLFILMLISVFTLSEAIAEYSINWGSVQYRKYENTEAGKPDKLYRVQFLMEVKKGENDEWLPLDPGDYADIDYVLVAQLRDLGEDDEVLLGYMAYGFTPRTVIIGDYEIQIQDIRNVGFGHIDRGLCPRYNTDLNSWDYGPPEYVVDGWSLEDVQALYPDFKLWETESYLALNIPKRDFERNFQVDAVGQDVFFILVHMTDDKFLNISCPSWYGKKKIPIMKAEKISVVQKKDGGQVIKFQKPSHKFGLDQRIFSENGGTNLVVSYEAAVEDMGDINGLPITYYNGFLWVKIPTHMDRCYVPARIVELMKAENPENFKVQIVLRTDDSNIRTYSEYAEFDYPLEQD